MAKVQLSAKADDDLEAIYTYTFREFGAAQADAYFASLEDRLNQIADHPNAGQDVSHIQPGYRRIMYAQHAIYYRQKGKNILIVRVLHMAQDSGRHM